MTPEEIAVKFGHHDDELAHLKERMEKYEQQQSLLNKLVSSVDKLAINMEYMAKEQKEQGERLERLEHEPAEDYKHYKRLIIGCIVTGLLSALVGAVITLIIKGGA